MWCTGIRVRRVEDVYTFWTSHIEISFCPAVFSFYKYDACFLWWFGLSPVSFSFFPFCFLSSLENYSLILLVVGISTLVLIFLFLILGLDHFTKVLFVFNFNIQFQFIKYYILQFGLHSLDFYFFSFAFCKSFIDF